MNKFKYLVSLMLVSAIALCSVGCGAKNQVKKNNAPDYKQGKKVDNNELLTYTDGVLSLSVDRESGNITVTENSTGRQWKSNPSEEYADPYAAGISKTNIFSQLTVSYVGASNSIEKTNSFVSAVKRKNVSFFKTENGFRVEYTFKEGFMIPVEYSVRDGVFEASILYTGITESDGVKISKIGLLPYFGTATAADDGFMLVPDGSGAVIEFNNAKLGCEPYEAKVYGVDESLPNDIITSRTEQVYIPLVGMKKNDGAYVALATDGAGEASIKAQPSGVETGFNSIFFEAVYRAAENLSVINGSLGTAGLVMYTSEEPTDSKRFTVRYAFVEETATLGKMVETTRKKLLQKDSIFNGEDGSSLYVDIYGGVSKPKSFMGIQYTGIEKLTTFEQAQQLLEDLSKDGADNLTAIYKNYSKNSFSGKIEVDLAPVGAIGSKKGIKQLYEFAKENNTDLYFAADFYSFTATGDGFSRYFDITKQLDLGAAMVYPKKINTNLADKTLDPYYFLSPDNFLKATERICKSADSLGIAGVYLENISNSLAGDYNIGGIKRSAATKKLNRAIKTIDKSIVLSSPNFYLWGQMDKAVNIPVSSSQHKLFDYDVPLLQMLLKGNIPYSGYPLNLSNTNDNSYLLHIAYAQNIHYSFIADDSADLQGTELIGQYGLSDYKMGEASQRAQKFAKYYSYIKDLQISDYRTDGRVSQTLFDDGTRVIVNYGDTKVDLDAISIDAYGWAVIKDGNILLTGSEQL